MNIFTKIKNSVYGPDYYKEVLNEPFSYSLKYYLILSLFLALIFAAVSMIKFIPVANFISAELGKVPEHFPINLEVVIRDGKVSANVDQPYFVKLPKDFKKSENVSQNTDNIENLIVINTKDEFNLQKFQSYKTLALLTVDNIIYINDKNQTTITSLGEVKNFVVNRQIVTDFMEKIEPLSGFLYPLIFVLSFIGGFMICLSLLAYLLFGALLVWLAAAVMGWRIGYKKSYQLGLHLMTMPVIFMGVVLLASLSNPVPFLLTILLVLSALLNIRKTLDTF